MSDPATIPHDFGARSEEEPLTRLERLLSGAHTRLGQLFASALPALSVFFFGVLLSLLAAGLAWEWAQEETRKEFADLAAPSETAVAHRIQAYTDALEGIRGLFLASAVDAPAFNRYVTSLDLPIRLRGIRAVTFIRRIPAAEGSAGAGHYVIQYAEPQPLNRHLLGFDLSTDPRRVPALDRARDSGQVTAAGQVNLLTYAGPETDFALRLAVYRDGMPHDTADERRANLAGLVDVIVSAEDMFRGMMSDQVLRQLRLRIYDAGPDQPAKPIYDSAGETDAAGDAAEAGASRELSRSGRLEVGGRVWTLLFTPREGFQREIDGMFAWMVLLGGLISSALVAGLVVALSGARRRALTLAEAMTSRLRHSQARLAEAQHMAKVGNWNYDFGVRRIECSEEASRLIGLDAGSATYGRCLRQMHAADRPGFRAAVGAATRRGLGFEIELRVKNGEQEMRWLQIIGLPMVNESAEVRLVRGTVMDVTERKRAELRRDILHEVTRQLAAADSLAAVTPRIIEAVCRTMGWECGAHWSWDAESATLSCRETWSSGNPGALAFVAHGRSPAFVPAQDGLLRRVVDAAEPLCAPDLARDAHSPRAPAAQASGLHGSYAFPILSEGKVLGVMEFFSRDAIEPDAALLAALRTIGSQIGLFCRRTEADEARRDSEARLNGIVNVAVEAIIAVDEKFRVILFNPAAQAMFGYSAEEAIGSSMERLIPSRLHEVHRHHVDQFVKGDLGVRNLGAVREILAVRANGEEFPVEASVSKLMHAGRPLYSVILNDITARKRDEQRLKYLADYDQLTALPNRSLFNQRLQRALAHAQRFNKALAVLFIDLDRFKNINDTLGHGAGDKVLQSVATRLMGCVRETDVVARLGGDEFVVLLEQAADARQASAVGQKLISAIAQSFPLEGREYHVTASIGISTYPTDGEDGATLLKNADIAMYRAKEQGKNNVQFYAPAMNSHSVERLSLESGLRSALQREEFLLHYQPKVDIASGRITGMEALVRWKRPESGMVSPAEFIPLAEETGLIVSIGEWVLKAACTYNHKWQRQGPAPLKVAVNLSARQFAQASLVRDVARILDVTGLRPEGLDLEITESMVMGNPEQAIQTLRQLKSMGLSISIDDFGTGYSSLGYLKRFPIDHIKIDRSFIKDIPEDNDDATITRTIIAMAHNLRLKVIAEGVETEAQLNFLREHRCDEMQGYYFSRPLAAEDFAALLQAQDKKAALAA
jgi:diguanylate cyclase (GGDEF)-like protein/PAS domain S-box-containing protein